MKNKGFTLIELLIVIGIIAVLMAIAIVAINPGRQFAKANNARRWGDVNAFANAIAIRIIEAKGSWDLTLTCEALPADGPHGLAWDDPGDAGDDDNVDICDCLIPDYFATLPVDPSITTSFPGCGVAYDTGYEITGNAAGRITISAPIIDDEGASTPAEISVSR